MFAEKAKVHPEKPAVLSSNGTVTYGDLLDAALRLANSLGRAGIVPGDVVAYQLSNHWICCAIDLAVAALGVIVAPFPPGRGKLDIQSLVRRCDARAVIVPDEYAGIDLCAVIESLRPTLLSMRLLIVQGKPREGWITLDSLLDAAPLDTASLPDVCPDSPVRLLVSSGTESEPKLVAYSHNALVGGRGRFLQRISPVDSEFRGLYLVPLGSSFGSTATFGVLCWLGGSLVVLPKFDVPAAIEAIAQFKPTFILGVPTMLQRIAAAPELQRIDKSSLLGLIVGGSVIDEATVRRCTEAFQCGFINLYGSADGVNCHNTLDDSLDQVLTSVGKPNPSVCERIHSPRGKLARLADKQLVRARVYKVYQGIAAARALLFDAARKFDAGLANSIEVNVTKLAASQALSDATDCAIQIMGAEGLADWTPLSGIYRAAKTTHILDGADDALISTIGRQLLSATAPGRTFDPLHPSISIARKTE